MVQAPQHFAHLKAEDDVLDVLNGAAFNIMNVIRNRPRGSRPPSGRKLSGWEEGVGRKGSGRGREGVISPDPILPTR